MLTFSVVALGNGENKHPQSNTSKEVKVDEDGFEIISSGPSEEVLQKINSFYQETVKNIFINKCLSCHGVNTSMPWYYLLPGVKQLMDNDMKEAKKKMDMSHDFPFVGHGSPVDDLDALKRTLEKENMPPLRYKLIHWNSGLTPDETRTIENWITQSKQLL